MQLFGILVLCASAFSLGVDFDRFLSRGAAEIRRRKVDLPLPVRTRIVELKDSQFVVSPTKFGGDPTGQKDSARAVQDAIDFCVNSSTTHTHRFPAGIADAQGCEVDLEGGEFLMSFGVSIPAYIGNLALRGGSLVAMSSFPSGDFLITIGSKGLCKNPQGSCNVDLNFDDLFLDGSRVGHGLIQVNSVMGTTIGPGFYGLNFTGVGVEINGGHEVMLLESWLGETNWDHVFSGNDLPQATAIVMDSNDNYVQNSIVFSSKVGLMVAGAANMFAGLHVWFPENSALQFNATAFDIVGSQNRFQGCYIDVSQATIGDKADFFEWTEGFVLGGTGFIFQGTSVASTLITTTEFQGGSGPGFLFPTGQPTFVDTRIMDNLFTSGRQGQATRVTKTVPASSSSASTTIDFCAEIPGAANIQSVQFSVSVSDGSFPVAVARPANSCNLTVEADKPFQGTITATIDASSYSSSYTRL